MAAVLLDPYLFFRGNCREAMEFYKSIFGGELTLLTYGDTKMGDESQKDLVMHAILKDGLVRLMASDTEQASDKAAKISLSLSGADEATLRSVFQKLSEGGNVFSELKQEFWGDTFGSLTDKYGVEWMVNIAAEQNS